MTTDDSRRVKWLRVEADGNPALFRENYLREIAEGMIPEGSKIVHETISTTGQSARFLVWNPAFEVMDDDAHAKSISIKHKWLD